MLGKAYLLITFPLLLAGCLGIGEGDEADDPGGGGSGNCFQPQAGLGAGSDGQGVSFLVDPMVASENPALSPTSNAVGNYISDVDLKNLGGRGVLEGTYVDVRTNFNCNESYGIFREDNNFQVPYSNKRFQEVMTYYYGDRYREYLAGIGHLKPAPPLKIVARCMLGDNAFYQSGSEKKVCLGDSWQSPGASYADDSTVVLHEIQHGVTVETYSTTVHFNRFWSDEAGAINESISDFMSLLFLHPELDGVNLGDKGDRYFSRWALGSFFNGFNGARGAHSCPEYDSDYPDCSNYSSGANGFSADQSTASFHYPDGVGWPFGRNVNGPGYLRNNYNFYSSQEEIHDMGLSWTGALWEAYLAVLSNHGGNKEEAINLVGNVVVESIKHLPQPSNQSKSPVTYRGMAQAIIDWAPIVGLTSQDVSSIEDAFEERGFYGGDLLSSGWTDVGVGTTATPGVRVQDNPTLLKSWLINTGRDPGIITQNNSTGTNSKVNPGESFAMWFDVENNDSITAGGLLLRIRSLNPKVTFHGIGYNDGYVSSSETQIRYHKVNGTDIVSQLSSSSSTFHVPTGNSYFKTNKYYSSHHRTSIWVRADSSLSSGETVGFEVEIEPTNGPTETVTFNLTVQ